MLSSTAPELVFRPAAVRLTLVLLAGLALVVIHVSVDRLRRPALEQALELTAVGDQQWYRPPEPPPGVPITAATFGGQPLVPVSYRRLEQRDARMTKIGEDDLHQYRIYTSHEPIPTREGEAERHGEPVYFLKTGLGEYVRVQTSVKAH